MIGIVERTITTALVIAAPTMVPVFVGAWVLLKFAGGWQRYKEPDLEYRIIYMVALIGNAVSFGSAILIGLWFHPESLDVFAK